MKFRFFVFFVVFLLFFNEGLKILDPDFGWQLKNGQVILTSGIFYKDLYSYTMPSFPVVSHEWGVDVLIAVIYQFAQFASLSFFFTLIFLLPTLSLSFFYIAKNYSKKHINASMFWNLSILTLSVGIFFNYFYVRPQVFSWIFWEILVLLFMKLERYNRYKYFLPFVFLFWANLHGGFAIGIFFVFFIAIYSSLFNRKIEWGNFLVAFGCLLATFINPFGITLWREVFSTFFSSNVRTYIQEWRSILSYGFSLIDFLLFFIVSISTVLLFYFRKKINFELIIIYFILLALGASSIKNIPYWIIFNLALSPQLIYLLYEKVSRNKISVERFKKAGKFIFISSIVLSSLFYYFYISYIDVAFRFYPEAALSYLNENIPKGQIFSEYGWGGYLIWKLPQKKVFIDGRMGVWNWKGNKSNETNNAFDVYNNILTEKINFNDVAKKYNIDTVLWARETDSRSQSLGYRLDMVTCRYVWLPNCKDLNIRLFSQILKSDGWKEVYSDKESVIYKRNLP
jgi:hypothetical protein